MSNITQYPMFYAPALAGQWEITLDSEETRHMKANRLKPESKVCLFNGKGLLALGTILKGGLIRIEDTQDIPKSETSLTIVVAVPKGDRADWMLQKLTELGVSTIIPLRTEHSVVLPREGKQERWQRIIVEACKQSKQAWIPELKPLSTIIEALQDKAKCMILLDPAGKPIKKVLQPLPKKAMAFIGPEGDFTDEEKEQLTKAGCVSASLGKQVLRVETAAIAMATAHNIFK